MTSILNFAEPGGVDEVNPKVTQPLLEVHALAKSYGAIHALKGVDVAFYPGEVHGLVGANGAGKSTLVKVLAGLEQPDHGGVRIDRKKVDIVSPAVATRLGLAFIHQELNLINSFSASQNIMLGSHQGSNLRLRRTDGIDPQATVVAKRIGIDFALDRPVVELTVHQKWLVSIARALVAKCRLLAMDEPTASLGAKESQRLLDVARDLANQGVAVLFTSHRLDEVLALCDRVTAFRDGAVSTVIEREQFSKKALVRAIVGHDVPGPSDRPETKSDLAVDRRTVLRLDDLRRGRELRGVSLKLYEGELLGIAGLVGAGRTELARAIFGADRIDSGTMTLQGRPYRPRSIADGIRHGIGYVSEERRAEALFLELSVTENLYASSWHRRRSWIRPLISQRRADKASAESAREQGVVLREAGVRQPISGLSGGNQQKVVIGRWLETQPQVLLLDEPTRGVDIGARSEIYQRIRDIRRTGMSVIVISSEFEELLECDRVVVMHDGAIVGELSGSDITTADMLRLCYH